MGRTLWVLMGTIGIVLLMACQRRDLLLVRADARRQEFAIARRWARRDLEWYAHFLLRA